MVNKEFVTVGDFLLLLGKELAEHGYDGKLNWSEQPLDTALEKRFVAAIIHEALLSFHIEEDEEEHEAARVLKDLYDCHTCVRHIAQIYVKGIMEAETEDIFGVHVMPTLEKIDQYINRIWEKGKRCKVTKPSHAVIETVSETALQELLCRYPVHLKVDVRDAEDFEKENVPAERINIPLKRLKQNPYQVSGDLNMPLFLYCKEGYLAGIAADILVKHNYKKVVVVIPDANR